jgi:hypothetical protein
MSETFIVTVDGVDLSTLGFTVASMPGWSSAPQVARRVVYPTGVSAGMVSPVAEYGPRVLTLSGFIDGATATARRATLRGIYSHLSRGLQKITFGDSPSQYIGGFLQGVPVSPYGPALEFLPNAATLVTFEFLCPDGAFYDTSATVVGLSNTPAAILTGTHPTGAGGVFQVNGSATNPILRLRNSAGDVVGEMVFTVTLSSGHWLRIYPDLEAVVHFNGTVEQNGAGFLTGGAFFRVSPEFGVFRSSQWPTVQVTSGTGTYTFERKWAAWVQPPRKRGRTSGPPSLNLWKSSGG